MSWKGAAHLHKDNFIFGGLYGFLAVIAMNVFQFPIWEMKVIAHPLAHYASSLFMNVQPVHHSLVGAVIGSIANHIYGAFWGIVFVYLIHLTGMRYLLLKGLVFGAFLWMVSFGGIRSLPIVALREIVPGDVPYYLFFHLVYGLTLGWLVKRFGERTLGQ
ncbi:MAG TPA: hypothetical protein VHR47_00495 [Bacillota bacterium]|nr:hypothetical protein [Bacillota bacterium]